MFSRSKSCGRAVLVNLLSGNAVHGVVTYETGKVLVIKGATIHTADSEPAPADGEVLVDRANVDFIQLL